MRDQPKTGETWRHYKGGVYEIVVIGLDEPTLTPVVVYRCTKDGQVWVRTMTAFMGTVDENGYIDRFQPRQDALPTFCPVEYADCYLPECLAHGCMCDPAEQR